MIVIYVLVYHELWLCLWLKDQKKENEKMCCKRGETCVPRDQNHIIFFHLALHIFMKSSNYWNLHEIHEFSFYRNQQVSCYKTNSYLHNFMKSSNYCNLHEIHEILFYHNQQNVMLLVSRQIHTYTISWNQVITAIYTKF